MRTNNLKVRRARSEEHGQLVELWERSVRATHDFLSGQDVVSHAQDLSAGGPTVDVNEANPAAVGFYRSLGFEVVSGAELDADGRPFPTLRMRRAGRPRATDYP